MYDDLRSLFHSPEDGAKRARLPLPLCARESATFHQMLTAVRDTSRLADTRSPWPSRARFAHVRHSGAQHSRYGVRGGDKRSSEVESFGRPVRRVMGRAPS